MTNDELNEDFLHALHRVCCESPIYHIIKNRPTVLKASLYYELKNDISKAVFLAILSFYKQNKINIDFENTVIDGHDFDPSEYQDRCHYMLNKYVKNKEISIIQIIREVEKESQKT